MADMSKRFPPSHAGRAKRIQDAYANFLNEMTEVRKARKGVLVKFIKRVEDVKIAEIKKKIKDL